MENASKALLIAGGVLIAIILITLLVNTYGNIGAFQRRQMTEEEIAKIEEYNKDFTKYLGQYVYGTEVITVINKVLNSEEDVKVILKFAGEYQYTRKAYKNGVKTERTVTVQAGDTMTITNEDDDIYIGTAIDNESTSFGSSQVDSEGNSTINGLKNRAFLCNSIDYDNSTGKVNKISFIEKKIQ